MRSYYVYILASRTRVLYVGVTNDLQRRVYQHRTSTASQFTARYRVTMLVHCEEPTNIRDAISREKQIKGWARAKKVALIEADNPQWVDLAKDWFNEDRKQRSPSLSSQPPRSLA
ncbi:MAG: GIY-YIG nuclease family protein [Dehalococcoidia bacterium]